MTFNEAKRICAELGMSLRKQSTYRVNYRNGIEPTAYYTDDLEDAVKTAKAMSKVNL